MRTETAPTLLTWWKLTDTSAEPKSFSADATPSVLPFACFLCPVTSSAFTRHFCFFPSIVCSAFPFLLLFCKYKSWLAGAVD